MSGQKARRLGSFVLVLSLLTGLLIAQPSSATDLSLPNLWSQKFNGNDLTLGRVLAKNSAYTRYAVSYRSGKFTISGIMNIPQGKGPFPVVVMAHGYIDPAVYRTGQGLAREQDYLARRGFVAFHTDYRNHATSDDDPNLMKRLRYGYVEDVINAAYAVKRSSLKRLNKNRVGLLGRSMGGGIAYSALVSQPGLFDSAVVYASVSSKAAENTVKWMANDPVVRREIYGKYGKPAENPTFWNGMSPYSYMSRVTEPLLVLHGTADDTCPVRWANEAVAELRRLNKQVVFVKYQRAGHTFYGSTWTASIEKSIKFLNNNWN
jgi:dipeptidyl aminopeptidase/acylaminoacyl peptidase